MKILLLLAAAGLLYLLQDFIYRNWWDKKLSVSIHFQDKAVLEGEEATLTEVIENRKLLPLTYLNVKFQVSRNLVFHNMENTSVSDFNYKSDVFSVLFHQRIKRKLVFSCQKRGYYEITQSDIISSNLLMTSEYVGTLPQSTYLYVYPRYLNIDRLDVPFKKMIGTMTSRQFLYEDPFEFRGIRDYTITDPMNSINWTASARTGDLMVNVHDSTSSQEAIIILNLETETVWVYEQLHEIAIRLAASISYYFLNASVPTRMICNGSDCITDQVAVIPTGSGLRHVNAIAEVLARIDLTRTVVSCTEQIKELTKATAGTASAPLYIMISNSMSDSLQSAFHELIKTGSSAMWIAPLYEDMELRVKQVPNLDIVRWEVNKYEN